MQAHGWYGFLHLTLQEYFAAVAANERGEAAVLEVARKRHSPWWEEVILLLAGRMADASSLLLALLGRDRDAPEPKRDESLAVDDDIFHGDLLLAARCLVGTPRLRVPWLRERLIGEVRQLLLQVPYRLVYLQAARVLAEFGGEASRADQISLLADPDISDERRAAIARAFGDVGDVLAAPHLLAIFKQQEYSVNEFANAILEALVALRYKAAVPVLLNIVKSRGREANSSEYRSTRLIRAVADLADKSIKSEIWSLIQEVNEGRARLSIGALAYAIGKLGDLEDVEPLFALRVENDNTPAVFNAITQLAGEAVAPRLMDIIVDADTNDYVAYDVRNALQNLNSLTIIGDALAALRNAAINWRRRWIIAELFGDYSRQTVETELADMLADAALDKRVKIKLAITLANWDNAAGIALLLKAFDKNTLPSKITFHRREKGNSISWWTWWDVANALERLAIIQLFHPCLPAWMERWRIEIRARQRI